MLNNLTKLINKKLPAKQTDASEATIYRTKGGYLKHNLKKKQLKIGINVNGYPLDLGTNRILNPRKKGEKSKEK